MDKQLADIEKALGLTQDTGMGPVNGSIPAPEANGQQPVQPQAPTATPTPTPGNNNNNNDNKQPLNEDVFKGIDTFSKGASFESPDSKKQKNKSTEYTLLAIEAVVFVVILCICVSIYSKIKKDGFSTDTEAPSGEVTEILDSEDDMTMTTGTDGLEVQEAGAGDEIIADIGTDTDTAAGTEPAPTSDSIDVENENFSLKCTNVTVVLDANNNPAALIYFTFVNKTSKLLSMSEVFPPSVTQNGEPCETFASLDEYPEEFYNKDTQISDGTSIDCCYSVSLKDAITPIRLTIHDNYETFSDVGTTEIPLQ